MTVSPSFDNNDKKQSLENIAPESNYSETAKLEAHPDLRSSSADSESLPTAGQLMRTLSQSIERVYREQIDQRPVSVKCTLLPEKVVIWIEGNMTPLEKMLYEEDVEKAEMLCDTIDRLMHQFLVDAVSQTLGTEVVTLISRTSYADNCTGMIAQLSTHPSVRISARKASLRARIS